MNTFEYIIQFLNKIVSGPAMLLLMVGVGIFLTFKLKFFQVTHFVDMFKTLFGSRESSKKTSQKSITPFQSLTTALAGTLGTGNIAGVATAIVCGGPGAVFWMWVSAFFGMVVKYAEVVLAVKYRTKNKDGYFCGGPMYYIEYGLKNKPLAVLFALLCVFASFGIGNMTQSNSASEALYAGFGINKFTSAVIFAILAGLVMLGGIKRIGKVTEKFVPLMALFYTTAGIIVLGKNISFIPEAFLLIFKSAFNFHSAVGGVAGYLVLNSVKYGISRGIFSNEAGLGSASIAHAASDTTPVKQGMWGIFEVFFDTIVMCTLTTLIILTSGLWDKGENGAALTLSAFSSVLGDFAGFVIAVSTALFAFAAILGWSYYGEKCIEYLFAGKSAITIYRTVYILLIAAGGVLSLEFIWDISDVLNGLMAIPNLIALVLLSGELKKITFSSAKNAKAQKTKDN